MIKLLLLLFGFLLIHAQESDYLFPNNYSKFSYDIDKYIKNAQHGIIILTPYIQHNRIEKTVIHAAQKGLKIEIFVTDISKSSLSLVQYENINLYSNSTNILETIILIDKNHNCTLNTPLDDEKLSSEHSFAQCYSDPKKSQHHYQKILPILKYSRPYLDHP